MLVSSGSTVILSLDISSSSYDPVAVVVDDIVDDIVEKIGLKTGVYDQVEEGVEEDEVVDAGHAVGVVVDGVV